LNHHSDRVNFIRSVADNLPVFRKRTQDDASDPGVPMKDWGGAGQLDISSPEDQVS